MSNKPNTFGKLIDGIMNVYSISNPIHNEDGTLLISDDADALLRYGYKKLVYTDAPTQEGYFAEYAWEESEREYVQVWTLVEEVINSSSTLEERIISNKGTANMLLECILEMSEILYA